jgi:hypothetical protein
MRDLVCLILALRLNDEMDTALFFTARIGSQIAQICRGSFSDGGCSLIIGGRDNSATQHVKWRINSAVLSSPAH